MVDRYHGRFRSKVIRTEGSLERKSSTSSLNEKLEHKRQMEDVRDRLKKALKEKQKERDENNVKVQTITKNLQGQIYEPTVRHIMQARQKVDDTIA